jgi:hypothetical protein
MPTKARLVHALEKPSGAIPSIPEVNKEAMTAVRNARAASPINPLATFFIAYLLIYVSFQ